MKMKFSHYKRPPNLCLLAICFYWQFHLNSALFLYTNNNNNNNQPPPLINKSNQQQQQQQQQQNPDTLAVSEAVTRILANSTQQPTSGNFLIKWEHNQTDKKVAILSIQPYEISNQYEPRIELRYVSKYPGFAYIDESTPNNSVVAAVMAADDDNSNVRPTVAIEHGNELGHFKLVTTSMTNTIQTSGLQMSRSKQSEYNLTIVATDNGTPPKSSRTNLVIKLYSSPTSQPSHLIPSPEPIQPKPPVTDLMYVGAMLVVIFSALIFLIIIGCALVQRPKSKSSHQHLHHSSSSHKGPHHPAPSSRATSATNSRLHPTDQCSAYCLGLTNLA